MVPADTAADLDTFPKLLARNARKLKALPAYREKEYGIWQSWTWGETEAEVLALAAGFEALGLGPQNEPTLGMTIYWAMTFNAVIRGLWWWLAMPIALIVLLFISLFLISAGLDQIANPRLRKAT